MHSSFIYNSDFSFSPAASERKPRRSEWCSENAHQVQVNEMFVNENNGKTVISHVKNLSESFAFGCLLVALAAPPTALLTLFGEKQIRSELCQVIS
jgi:hypothetical protein